MDNIARMIDHTILKATATLEDIEKLCDEALEYEFATVCINPVYITTAAKKLKNSKVGICTVVGFPLGAARTSVKATEALDSINSGATEIDMVIPIGLVKSGKFDLVLYDIEQVARICHSKNTPLKVILETCYLTDDEITKIVEICNECEVDYIKTSTGFGEYGATEHHVALMKSLCKNNMQVKASGGIRSLADATKMIELGATRLGTSNGVEIMKEYLRKS